MIFSSYEFVFLFLPIVFIGYFSLGRLGAKSQRFFLVLSSFFFYGFFNPNYLWIILGSIGFNYLLAKAISLSESKGCNKMLLFVGILFNIGMLGYFKYTDFFLENVNKVLGTDFSLLKILLPLGISFFTFQQFSFLISVFKKEEKIGGFVEYCIFVTFFPQLVAGPIVLYSEMMPQFSNTKPSTIMPENVARGLYIFVLGMFKKIVIADSLAIFVDNGFDTMGELGFIAAWVVSLSYTFQIYFDFSGYCDMAVGLGRMFNINLPMNFNSPYKSKSITEFWRRWHMTLGRALANYVYIPLGGNRKGSVQTYINLMLTFIASGLWHGAAWSFVLWGFFHGVFSVLDRLFDSALKKVPKAVRIAGTFCIVNILWVMFRAQGLKQAAKVYRGMFIPKEMGFNQFVDIARDGVIVNMGNKFSFAYIMGVLIVCMAIVWLFKNNQEKLDNVRLDFVAAVTIALLFVISVVHMSRISPFIYFNF